MRSTLAVMGFAMLAATPVRADPCGVDAAQGEDVVIAGATTFGAFAMVDGRVVRLAGLDPASLRAPAIEGEEATLIAAPRPDRHGALRGDLIVDGTSLSERLVADGSARVRPAPGDIACYARLLGAENAARQSRLGLWGEQRYAVLDASDADAVGRAPERFAILSGRIQHVGVGADRIFMDFGTVWKTDVTVVIAKRDRERFVAAGLAPESLDRRLVRVRGVLTQRNGPLIEVTEPAAIEALDEGTPKRASEPE